MSGALFTFAGSLIAVCGLIAVAWGLRLGGRTRLANESQARELADDAICGFTAVEVALDAGGKGALLRDGQGRIMLLRAHGAHFAARLLDRASTASRAGALVTIATGERAFASTVLDLGDAAPAWERRVRALQR